MRRVVPTAVLLLLAPLAAAQHFHHAIEETPDARLSPCKKLQDLPFEPPALTKDLQVAQFPVTHATEHAQEYFNQAMMQYYGFNYEEALRNFRAAAEANGPSKEMAMASWGLALAAGPNINLGMDDRCRVLAQTASKRAGELADIQHVSTLERKLIAALPLRYDNPADPMAEAVAYSVAMGKVWDEANQEPNVGALYAESMLDLRPWAVYDACERPALDTDRIEAVLKDAMGDGKDPKTIGAQHLWIHTVEASATPGVALESANRLRDWEKQAEDPKHPKYPGHLAHMPSHVYFLTGDYAGAADSNKTAAWDLDWDQYFVACDGGYSKYSGNAKCPQLYFGHYLCHNFYFRAVALAFLGQSDEALHQAGYARGHAERFVANEPGLQRYMAGQIMALVMNRHWDAILKDETGPPSDCYAAPFTVTGCHIIRSIWRWARGMARAERGELADAHKEYGSMADEMRQIVPPTPTRWGNNSAAAVLAIPRSLLKARILWAEGKNDEAIAHLKLAVTHEDALVYDEPPQWFPPAREALGGAYLQLADCEAAASIFNAELGRHRESGRALYGLMRALKRAGMSYDEVEKRFIKAWHADHKLDESRLWPPRKAGAAATGGKWPCQPIPESD